MRFIRRHWYSLGLALGVIAVACALLGRPRTVQVILLLNFAALTLHQFEEYGWPGGFPWILNAFIRPRGGPLDRYPLNQNNALGINVVLAWPFHLIPVFASHKWYLTPFFRASKDGPYTIQTFHDQEEQ